MLSKVATDETHLTTNRSAIERDHIINKTQLEGCPVPEHNLLWLEDAFVLLLDFFGKENATQRRILTPQPADFPISYDGTEHAAYQWQRRSTTGGRNL